jgi:elongation factor 3
MVSNPYSAFFSLDPFFLPSSQPQSEFHVLKTLQDFATNKKSGFERESAAIAFHSFATILGVPAAPLLLNSLPTLFELYMDKGEVVRAAATTAVKAILKLFPAESTPIVFRKLESILDNGKWRTKVGVLESFKPFVTSARDAVAAELGTTLPKVEAAMHDTKQEVRADLAPLPRQFTDLPLSRYHLPLLNVLPPFALL